MKKYEVIKVDEENNITVVHNKLEELRQLNAIKVKAEILEKEIKQELQEAMEEFGLDYIDTDVFKANLVKPTTSNRFDTRAFRKDHPELAEEYTKQTNRKGYIKVEYHD